MCLVKIHEASYKGDLKAVETIVTTNNSAVSSMTTQRFF